MLIQPKPLEKIHPHCACSQDGARFEIVSAEHRFRYTKEGREISMGFDWIINPDGLVLDLGSSRGFEGLDRSGAYEVLADISRALKFLGFRTETDGDLPHDRVLKKG